MLTPKLDRIKSRLEKLSKDELTPEEEEFLKELQFLDKSEIVQKYIETEGEDFLKLKIVHPPPDRCPCCGRKL